MAQAEIGPRRWETHVFHALMAVIFVAPLPLGSNRSWALGALACAVLALTLWTALGLWWQGDSLRERVGPGWRPLGFLAGLVVLQACQVAGGSGFAWAAGRLGSMDPFQTRQMLLCSLLYTGAFFSLVSLASGPQAAPRVRRAMFILLAGGVCQAALAIALWSTHANYQFMYVSIRHEYQALGTFANRNHLACYLYLCLSVGVGLMVQGLLSQRAAALPRLRHWQQWLVAVLRFALSPRMRIRLWLVMLVIALVLTRSRMGNLAFLSATLCAGAAATIFFRRWRRSALWLVASLIVVDGVVVGQWVGLDRVVERLEGTAMTREAGGPEESVEARTEPGRLTWAMLRDRPWFGTGAGTYYMAFPPYKTPHVWMYFDHAHNDYAEWAADMGYTGLALAGGLVATSALRALRMLNRRQRSLTRGVGMAACMALVAVAVHSTVDFNLQIPANALTLTTLLALAWAAPLRSRRPRPASSVDRAGRYEVTSPPDPVHP